jgi:predicted nucleic-acid-binding protein
MKQERIKQSIETLLKEAQVYEEARDGAEEGSKLYWAMHDAYTSIVLAAEELMKLTSGD